MPKHFSTKEKERILNEIVTVGLEMFERHGISKVSITDITDKVKISKGSFYNFFNSKGDLFMEIYRRQRDEAHREVYEEVTNGESDLLVMIDKYIKAMHRRIKERPILEMVYDPASLMMISDKAVKERLLEFNDEINKQLTKMVEEWMAQDGQYAVEPKIVQMMFRSLNFLRFHEQAIGAGDFDVVMETMTQAVIEYIKKSKVE